MSQEKTPESVSQFLSVFKKPLRYQPSRSQIKREMPEKGDIPFVALFSRSEVEIVQKSHTAVELAHPQPFEHANHMSVIVMNFEIVQ
jgi:hypothetical protein